MNPMRRPLVVGIDYRVVVLVTLFAVLVLGALARTTAGVSLPVPTFADTEVVTNMSLAVSLDTAGRFSFSLTCVATPTNNVEVAFGKDANGNGILDVGEIERMVGWDCGAWFTRGGADGECVTAETNSAEEIRTLSWELKTGLRGTPFRLSVMAIFSGLPLDAGYSPAWNMMRLAGRGIDASQENFSITVSPDSTAIFMR